MKKMFNIVRATGKITAVAAIILVVCLMSTIQIAVAEQKDWNLYCITGGDCAMYDPNSCSTTDSAATDTNLANIGAQIPDDQIPGSSLKEKEWNYLIGLGFKPVEAAGILGNIANEGVYDPQSVEDGHGLVARSKDPYDAGSYGWGLFGFTPGHFVFGKDGSYWEASNKAADIKVTKDNVYFISTQMDVEYAYMQYNKGTSGKSLLDEYKARATSPAAAAAAWMELAEKPLYPNYGPRQHDAIALMNKFGHGGGVKDSSIAPTTSDTSGDSCCGASPDDASNFDLPVTGDVQELAKQVLNNSNVTFDYGPGGKVAANFKLLAKGEEARTDTGRNVKVQPILLVALLAAAQDHKVTVSSLTDGPSHVDKNNPHGMGDAMDIDYFDGQGTNGSDDVANKLIRVLEGVLPSGSRFGMGNGPFSGAQTVDGKSFTAFHDNPSHVHFDVVGVDQNAIDKAVAAGGSGEGESLAAPPSTQACCPAGDSGAAVSGGAPGTVLIGKTPREQVYNYFFQTHSLSAEAAAAAVGNLDIESAGFTVIDGYGGGGGAYYGLAQWSPSRRAGLVKFAGGEKNAGKLNYQLDYVWHELTTISSYKPTLDSLKGNDSLQEKVHEWGYNYEGALNPDGSVQLEPERQTSAKTALREFGGGAAGGAAVSGVSCSSAGAGTPFILGDYAWPVDMSKKEVESGYPWPCPGKCHHDGTYAFDLTTKKTFNGDDKDVVGRAEYAITDGTVDFIEIYNGIPGCYMLQMKSSTDGFEYAYLHARNPAVKEGDKVKVGQKIAEVGERKCTGNGSYPHLHFDRGSPKGAGAGRPCCRDPGTTSILNRLYAALPN